MERVKHRIWNQSFSRTHIKNNIIKVWDQCSEEDKHDWYGEAHKAAYNILGGNIEHGGIQRVTGVIAALSPRLHWDRNLAEADQMWRTGDCKQIGLFKDKARKIIDSSGDEDEILSILNGEKIKSFYLNIRYPDKAISLTIDRHMLSICMGKKLLDADLKSLTVPQYKFLEDCVRYTAARLNVNPLLLQSATWVRWRKLKH